MKTHTVTLSKGGTNERKVSLGAVDIPDLWHIAPDAGPLSAPLIIEAWHIAHDLKRELHEAFNKIDELRAALLDLVKDVEHYADADDCDLPDTSEARRVLK